MTTEKREKIQFIMSATMVVIVTSWTLIQTYEYVKKKNLERKIKNGTI